MAMARKVSHEGVEEYILRGYRMSMSEGEPKGVKVKGGRGGVSGLRGYSKAGAM